MKRKRGLLITGIILLILFVLFFIFYLKPKDYKSKIVVNTYNLNTKDDKTDKKNLKVVVFSDLNLGFDYQVKDLTNLVNKINDTKPDVVVFNGDLIAKKLSTEALKSVTNQLKDIKALYGKFANLGESDDKEISNLLVNADFEVINNQARHIYHYDKMINLIFLNGNNYDTVLSKVNDNQFNMAITHNPNLINDLLKYKLDVIVAGHTLGGEYTLPFYGSIYDELKQEHYRGKFKDGDTQVVISNGIGTKHHQLRLLAPSSIELFNIK